MTKIIVGDPREPVAGHLNYAAHIETPHPFFPMGPNTLGELLWPVTVEQGEGVTRVGFAYEPPVEVGPKFALGGDS